MKKRASKTPYHTSIHVTDALLSEFTTNNTDTLRYNLALHITLRNPNKDFRTHYDNIAVMSYYQDKKFVAENYSHIFYQERDGTTLLKLSFKGQQDMDATIGVDKLLIPGRLSSVNVHASRTTILDQLMIIMTLLSESIFSTLQAILRRRLRGIGK
ncbi:hypothetical protein ACLB2K_075573 [Fragaria x ananassa]